MLNSLAERTRTRGKRRGATLGLKEKLTEGRKVAAIIDAFVQTALSGDPSLLGNWNIVLRVVKTSIRSAPLPDDGSTSASSSSSSSSPPSPSPSPSSSSPLPLPSSAPVLQPVPAPVPAPQPVSQPTAVTALSARSSSTPQTESTSPEALLDLSREAPHSSPSADLSTLRYCHRALAGAGELQ
jgi:hypothetical protein